MTKIGEKLDFLFRISVAFPKSFVFDYDLFDFVFLTPKTQPNKTS